MRVSSKKVNQGRDNGYKSMSCKESATNVDFNDGNFFHSDGMVLNIFEGTIAINGFATIVPSPLNVSFSH